MGQVLTTHLDRIRRNEAAQTIPDTDDEKVRQIGKSNLDKWLQVLLFKDVDSGGSSPGQESPLHRALSPALSQMSIAAMRGSMELQASRDQVKDLLTQHASFFWNMMFSASYVMRHTGSNKLTCQSSIKLVWILEALLKIYIMIHTPEALAFLMSIHLISNC